MLYHLKKVGVNKYQLSHAGGKVDIFVYASEPLIKNIQEDLSLEQLVDAASLPQVISPVIAMPDIHQGFGLPIGGVMVTAGLISIGAVGMDINCGVRLMTSNLTYNPQDFSTDKLKTLINQVEKLIPIGLGGRHKQKINLDLQKLCELGVEYLVKQGYAFKHDLAKIEEKGRMLGADFSSLSDLAKKRALKQVGTLGSGNHFIEIQQIKKIFDPQIAQNWGLRQNQICVMIHSGSRALGHQTCLDFTNLFWQLKDKYAIKAPRKELAALPLSTEEGKRYFGAMASSVNFAF